MKFLVILAAYSSLSFCSQLPLLYENNLPPTGKVHEKHYGKADQKTLDYGMEQVTDTSNMHQEFHQKIHVSGQPENVEHAIKEIENADVRDKLMKEHQQQLQQQQTGPTVEEVD